VRIVAGSCWMHSPLSRLREMPTKVGWGKGEGEPSLPSP